MKNSSQSAGDLEIAQQMSFRPLPLSFTRATVGGAFLLNLKNTKTLAWEPDSAPGSDCATVGVAFYGIRKTSKTLSCEPDSAPGSECATVLPRAPAWGLRVFGVGRNPENIKNISMGVRFCPGVRLRHRGGCVFLELVGIWNTSKTLVWELDSALRSECAGMRHRGGCMFWSWSEPDKQQKH